jgi:glyoxylase I family protein
MTQHEAPQRSDGIWRPTGTDDAVVRYLIADLDRGIEFYTNQLGFELEQRAGPIAVVSRGALHLILSAPESSGARPLADGQSQAPGGWNRIVLYVDDIEAEVNRLRGAGVTFRNDIKVGPGGKQIQITDPDGNSIELHEAPA